MAYLLDNGGRGDYIQKYNVADELDDNVREKILNIFLGLLNYWIISIIKLKPYTKKNSAYVQALQIELTCEDRRSPTSIHAIIPLPNQVKGKVTYRRVKRGSTQEK